MSPSDLFGPAGNVISGAFDRMEIAEKELADAPYSLTPTLFIELMPPSILSGFADTLYQAHARELVQRSGEDLDAPTSAELVAALSEMSLRKPLNHAGTWLMWKHFIVCYPGKQDEPYADTYDRNDLAPDIERGLIRKLTTARGAA